jgi:hypothetical protein
MAGFQKILITLLVLVLILLALVFSLNNQMAVSLNFLLFEPSPTALRCGSSCLL